MTETRITTGGKERVERTVILYKDAFRNDPVITYMLCNLSRVARYAYLHSYFTSLLTAAGLNGAAFHEANDFGACSVVIAPGRRVDNPWTLVPAGLLGALWKLGFSGCMKMLVEYGQLSDAAKAKGLGEPKTYYYVFFVATEEKSRGKGLSSALIRKAQENARRDSLPLWLEATTEYSWKLYEKLGFETVDRWVLGKGHAAADGTAEKGGDGVPVWGMVWWPSK